MAATTEATAASVAHPYGMRPSRWITVVALASTAGCGRVEDDASAKVEVVDTADAAMPSADAAREPTSPRHTACNQRSSTTPEPPAVVDASSLPDLGFRVAAPMNTARSSHASCVLADGRLLVAGGTGFGHAPDVEVYDASADRWTTIAVLPADLQYPLTCVAIGPRVALFGRPSTPRMSILDPETGVFSETTNPPVGESFAKMQDGRILATDAGKWSIYDPASATWSLTGYLPSPIAGPLDALPDGRFIVHDSTGGDGGTMRFGVFDVRTRVWKMSTAHWPFRGDQIVVLHDGRLLFAGYPRFVSGEEYKFVPTPFALLDPECDVSTMTPWLPRQAAYRKTFVLPSGKVLVLVDSHYPTGKSVSHNVTAVFDPVAGNWSLFAPRSTASGNYDAPSVDALPTGQVVLAGGAPLCGSGCSTVPRDEVFVLDHPP